MLPTFKSRLKWRTANLGRIISHRLGPVLDPDLRELGETLRRDGIAVCDIRFLLGGDAGLFDAVRAETLARWKSETVQARALQMTGEKNFKVKLMDREVSPESPLLRISLHPRVLALVNHYMQMRSYLRDIDLWWDRPTEDPAAATQLWHRDLDDARCIKAFIYLEDVDERTGPFTYMPKTHMFGEYAGVTPGGSGKNRFTDEEMKAPLGIDKARIVTGKAGTMIFCDTYGFHRGAKPERDRLMSLFQYVSRASKYPREFRLLGEHGRFDRIQQQALEAIPAGARS
jgi:hypothetical protein